MCLSVVYRGKAKKEALAKLPDSFYVWKVVMKCTNSYCTPYKAVRVFGGEIRFKTNVISVVCSTERYRGGGHVWRSRKVAQQESRTLYGNCMAVRCRAKKSDITTIGEQWGKHVIVLKKAIFPKWVGKAQ